MMGQDDLENNMFLTLKPSKPGISPSRAATARNTPILTLIHVTPKVYVYMK